MRQTFTVSYPRRLMITGRNSWTDWRGTPRQISIPVIHLSQHWSFGARSAEQLMRHTQYNPASRVLEDLQRLLEHERLIYLRRRINLHAVEGQFLLILCQKLRSCSAVRQVPERKHAEEYRAASLDDEEISPVSQLTGMDLKHSKGK